MQVRLWQRCLLPVYWKEKVGVRTFLRRYIQWRVDARWYFIVFFGYPLIYVAAAMIWLGLAPLQNIVTQWSALLTTYLPAMLIFPALITWGEEPGWRGFAQTRLQERYGALKASLIVGFLHGLWNWPIFLIVNGPVASAAFNPVYFAQNTFTIMVITMTWTWVFNNTNQSILVAVLIHASGNAVGPFMSTWIPDFPQPAQYTVLAFYVVIALSVVVFTKGRLAYKPSDQ